jgi:hypothetical protein
MIGDRWKSAAVFGIECILCRALGVINGHVLGAAASLGLKFECCHNVALACARKAGILEGTNAETIAEVHPNPATANLTRTLVILVEWVKTATAGKSSTRVYSGVCLDGLRFLQPIALRESGIRSTEARMIVIALVETLGRVLA